MDKKKILLIDDDVVLRNTLTLFLELRGYTVVVEEQGNTAFHTYRTASWPWFFVLSDFQFLPGLTISNGASLVAEILHYEPTQRLAIFSGEPDMAQRALSYLQGINRLNKEVEVPVFHKLAGSMANLCDAIEKLATAP